MGPILFVVGMGCLLAWGWVERRARPLLFVDLSAFYRAAAESARRFTDAMNRVAWVTRQTGRAVDEFTRAYTLGGYDPTRND